jgi:hypothetical protein
VNTSNLPTVSSMLSLEMISCKIFSKLSAMFWACVKQTLSIQKPKSTEILSSPTSALIVSAYSPGSSASMFSYTSAVTSGSVES